MDEIESQKFFRGGSHFSFHDDKYDVWSGCFYLFDISLIFFDQCRITRRTKRTKRQISINYFFNTPGWNEADFNSKMNCFFITKKMYLFYHQNRSHNWEFGKFLALYIITCDDWMFFFQTIKTRKGRIGSLCVI